MCACPVLPVLSARMTWKGGREGDGGEGSSGDRALTYELSVPHRQLCGPKQVLSCMIDV